MFCPKCGSQNPETVKFCRSCGIDLGNVSQALTGTLPQAQRMLDRRGSWTSWDQPGPKLITGLALLASAIAAILSGGYGWWYLLLIPAFIFLGAGVGQLIQLKKAEKAGMVYPSIQAGPLQPGQNTGLPPPQTEWAAPDSRYKTGDLVPPSVAEGTTRHLELDREGQTMTLPKK